MSDKTLDAYVFVPSGSQETMNKLYDLWTAHQIRYATRVLSGEFGSVAFVEVETEGKDPLEWLAELERKLTAVRDQVNPGTSVGVALKQGPRAPTRWSEKLPFGAYVRIRTAPGKAQEVFDRLDHDFGGDQFGSAMVAGDWDIMVEVDAESLEVLSDRIVNINAVPNVLSTDSALVLTVRHELTGPPSH